jgi:hypothetical protein
MSVYLHINCPRLYTDSTWSSVVKQCGLRENTALLVSWVKYPHSVEYLVIDKLQYNIDPAESCQCSIKIWNSCHRICILSVLTCVYRSFLTISRCILPAYPEYLANDNVDVREHWYSYVMPLKIIPKPGFRNCTFICTNMVAVLSFHFGATRESIFDSRNPYYFVALCLFGNFYFILINLDSFFC